MGTTLLISEKPSVSKALAAVLGASERKNGYFEGGGYLVSWCLGHLLELEHAGVYDERWRKWRYADLPIIPQNWKRAAIENKAGQLAILRELVRREDVDTIVNSCDAGREGELIWRTVYEYCCAGLPKDKCPPVKRLWISSLEDSAIRAGLQNMKDSSAYDNLYAAALCREKADWLVGCNATRLFSVLYGVALGIGRVQSPTLSLLAERETNIAKFAPKDFYIPTITIDGITAQGKRMDKEQAEAVRTACAGQTATVKSVETVEKSSSAPELYDLTALQQDANHFYGYTAKETLDYAQALYEKRLIGYPRSSSRYVTRDMAAGIEELANGGIMCIPNVPTPLATDVAAVVDDAKVSDHAAILPTMNVCDAEFSALPSGEKNVLTLVVVRLACALAPPRLYAISTVTLACAGYAFTATGKTVTQEGWKSIDAAFRATLKEVPEDAQEAEEAGLPPLQEGQTFSSASVSIHAGKTTAPKRFTEGTLLAAMDAAGAQAFTEDVERRGLGTPATRAAVIEKLVKSGFVHRQGKTLVPTSKGLNLIAVLPSLISSPALTAAWENELARIARSEVQPEAFLAGIEALVRQLVSQNSQPNPGYIEAFLDEAKRDATPALGQCPRCGSAVREGTKGFFCDDRACGFRLWKDNRFFQSKGKTLDAALAAQLLKEGRAFVKGMVSPKTGKCYDAQVVLDDDGTITRFGLDFDTGRKK